jgi:hypothetical protein
MDWRHLERLTRIITGIFLIASLGTLSSCGGGGGGGNPSPAPKSGDVVWTQMNDPSPIEDQPYGMAISGSNMYVVGFDSNTPLFDDQWHIEKRNLGDGSLVAAFSTIIPGVVVSNPSSTTINSFDDAYAVAVDSTAMYVVGFDSIVGDNDWAWHIEKRDLVTGGLIMSFGSGTGGGYISENISTGPGLDDAAFAVAVDSSPTGTMYIVGYTTTVFQGTEWQIEARDKVTGLVVSSVTTSMSIGDDVANAIAIDPVEGYMYVVGTDASLGSSGWRIEKRTLSGSLSLDSTFGSSGFIYEDPSSSPDEPLAIVLDSTFMYIAGYETSGATVRWRIEKRRRSDGSLETTSFGGAGKGFVVSNTATNAVANAIAIDSNYMYIAGYDNAAGGTFEWRIEKRDLVTGALVTSFGSNGVVVNDFGSPSFSDSIRAVDVDSSYIYVAGYESVDATNSRWRIMKIVK